MTHCHNDFAMATACTLFSDEENRLCAGDPEWSRGKDRERGSGRDRDCRKAMEFLVTIDMKKLYAAAKLVEEISKIPISPLKPVVGENVFKRESGVTATQLISYPPAVEGYSPELLGREREVLLSKKVGERSVGVGVEELNMSATPTQVDEV